MYAEQSYQMQIEWNEQTTEWFQRASDYTGFHSELAEILKKKLAGSSTLCDLGCGAGMIDFKLENDFDQITCVDRVPDVVRILQNKIKDTHAHNITTICSDIQHLSGKWDSCLMLFVGLKAEELKDCLRLCRDKLLVIYRGGCTEMTSGKRLANQYNSLIPFYREVRESGIQCTMESYELEYGQPFTDLEDAYNYVKFYNRNPWNCGVMDYIHQYINKTYQLPYPYYLPHKKRFGILEIRKSENLNII